MQASNPLQKKYKRICTLGEGSYGTVYLFEARAQNKNTVFETIFQGNRDEIQQYVAVKIYKKPNSKNQGIDFSCLREITSLQVFKHKNILSCIEVLYSHKKDQPNPYQIATVMPFHLELKLLLQKSDFQNKKRITKHIVEGLNHLHCNYFFHRDLKPDNIFVSKEGYVKIADFGFTKEYGTPYKKYTYNACTLEYRAPQLFISTYYYTQKSDIWSLGCIIIYLFTGKQLFESDGSAVDIDLLSQIFYYFGTPSVNIYRDQIQNWPGFQRSPIKYNFKPENPKNLMEELKLEKEVNQLITFIMKLNPSKRPSAAEILQHSFFENVSSESFQVSEIYEKKIKSLIK